MPWTPGNDGGGIIVDVGEGVDKQRIGTRVWLSKSLTGTYAEYCLTNSSNAHELHKDITLE